MRQNSPDLRYTSQNSSSPYPYPLGRGTYPPYTIPPRLRRRRCQAPQSFDIGAYEASSSAWLLSFWAVSPPLSRLPARRYAVWMSCWTSKDPNWDSGEALVNYMILTCCSHIMDRNWKGQNTGGALAVTKGLVGQVEGLVGKFPHHFVW